MPSLISVGWSIDTTREMIGRSCRFSPRPWANCRPNADISSGKPNSFAFGNTSQICAGLDAGDSIIEPLACLLVCVVLRGRRAYNIEGPVVAGAIAHEALQDVEE